MKKQYENPMVEIQVVDDIDILTCSTNPNCDCDDLGNGGLFDQPDEE